MNEEQAATVASTEYGLEVRAERLPCYDGENFLLQSETGERYVLKSAGETETDDRLDLQNRVLTRLEVQPITTPTPKLVAARDGREIVEIEVGAERPARLRLITYLPGQPWGRAETPPLPSLLLNLGRAVGELDRTLLNLSHPAAHTDFEWRPQNAIYLGEWVPTVETAARQAIVDRFLHLLAATLRRYENGLRRSLIHGDINEHNLLIEEAVGGAEAKIAGFIDFGDLTSSYTVYDPAMAAGYASLGREDPLDSIARVAAGFHEVFPLNEAELAAFFPLACSRLVQSVIHSARRRAEGGNDPHFFLSEAQAWRILETLSGVAPAAAFDAVRRACGLDAIEVRGNPTELLEARQQHLGANLSLAYERPLEIHRGAGQYLYDQQDRPYLDLVNNVAHVGHCHPRVVAAGVEQMGKLNTNTRYLHDAVIEYSDRLRTTLPDPLEVCFFVCSGSEANELAIRLARTHTGRAGLIVLDGAYHGHSGTLIGASPYKFTGPGGSGRPGEHVYVAPMPDGYRGAHRGSDSAAGAAYAADLGQVIDGMDEPLAAFLCEPVLGCGGQIVPPQGFLSAAYGAVRRSGGVCIADEVQAGFGRVGTHFWSFQDIGDRGLVPDIVVMGKPIGNGHPMAAVVTTREIASSFANGMEFFSTCGGNPVSCRIGLAVLDVIEEEALQDRALRLGKLLREELENLAKRHHLIGDIRGRGLFAGIELVRDRETLEPAAGEASVLVETLKDQGVLLSTDGPLHNVLKIKPPMVLTERDIGFFVRALDRALATLYSKM